MIKLPEGKLFKYHLLLALTYQTDNYKDFEVKQVRELKRILKDPDNGLSKKEKKEYKDYIDETEKEVDAFISFVKKISKEEQEIWFNENELRSFKDTLTRQIKLAEWRIEDFKIDLFGWGKENCKKLITEETEFIESLRKILETAD